MLRSTGCLMQLVLKAAANLRLLFLEPFRNIEKYVILPTRKLHSGSTLSFCISLSRAQALTMSELKISFLGAFQASSSVLLVISYGVVAAQFDLLKGSSTKQISTLCVRMFLPALLITNVGSQLHADTGMRYVPIFGKCCKRCTDHAS